jgi:GNAT superfamily N-acetyltransferase
MQIRAASLADIEQLSVLFDQYRGFYKQPSDISAALRFMEERMLKKESAIIVAEWEKKLYGFTQLYPIFSSVSMQRSWLLNDLYVAEKARGKGVATALLNAAAEYGVSTQAKWLLLQTGKENFTAQALYEKNGWKPVSDCFYQLDL